MVVRDCQTLLDNATSDIDKARLLAVKADHGSEWIFALPISTCDLPISNEAVRIANLILALAVELLTLRGYMGSHASAAQVVPYVTSKSTILSGVPYADQTLSLSKNRQVCSTERKSVSTGLY